MLVPFQQRVEETLQAYYAGPEYLLPLLRWFFFVRSRNTVLLAFASQLDECVVMDKAPNGLCNKIETMSP